MALLGDLTNRFKHLLSPSESRQRRDKEFKAKVPPLPKQVSHETPARSKTASMSPGAAITTWNVNPSPRPALNLDAEVDGAQLPPSPPTSFGQADTDNNGEILSDVSASNIRTTREDWDANEETILVDDGYYDEQQKDGQKIAELERERREAQAMELRAAGWSEDSVFLFQKLGLRGFEPLLPYGWYKDFQMLPADLFTHNMDKAFIKPLAPDGMYRAERALKQLFNLGGRVRDAVLQKAIRTPEMRIHKAVSNYACWAVRDAQVELVHYQLPLFEIVACRKDVSPKTAEGRMIKKLDTLAEKWRAALAERRRQDGALNPGDANSLFNEGPDIPTLYGVVACHTVMAFVSYDVHAATPVLRTVAMFDLGQEGYDVWNSLAIAIFAIHCRNRLVQLKEFVPRPAAPTVEDPDV